MEFNGQNVINWLMIERIENGYRLSLGPIWGLNGFLDAKRISVKVSAKPRHAQ